MSRLVNPGAGDYADRLTILALKLLYGEQQGQEVKHFRDERNAILPKMLSKDSGKWLEAYTELAAVNAALWQAEDQLREYKYLAKQPNPDSGEMGVVAEIAFRIQDLNDRRAALVALINQKAGDTRPEEKEKL